MKIGFFVKWPKGSLSSTGNVIGDELHAEALCQSMLRNGFAKHAVLYAPNHLPPPGLDVMVYLNDTPPQRNWAARHVAYVQNAYGEGSDRKLREFQAWSYDGYAFMSHRLLEMHRQSGLGGIFLPFGVDLSTFYPRPKTEKYSFDVAYVGNDIKGIVRSTRYLLPAAKFNFGLYGNWSMYSGGMRRFWRRFFVPDYRRVFHRIARGKIPQDDVPVLYSSAAINLNCTAQDCVDWDVITLRTLEVLACRGFLISDRVPSAERELEGCMVFTDGGQDLADKIAYYLDRPKERDEIAGVGCEYVRTSASVDARARELVDYLKAVV